MGSGSSGSSMGSGSSSGADTGSSGSAASASKQHVTGTVGKIDQTNNQLSLQLKVNSSTQVMKDGQKASISDIKEGDQVRASLSPSGAVQRIDIMSSGSTGSSGMGAPSGSGSSYGGSGAGGTGTGTGTKSPSGGSPSSPSGGSSGTSQ
jgi:hypothetical protein